MSTALQNNYERQENLADIRERFAHGLVSDLKEFGKAEYYENGQKETLKFSHVIENFDCDLDDEMTNFFTSPIQDEVSTNRLRTAMYEKAQDLAEQIAKRVYP